MPTVEVNGIDTYYEDFGSGHPIVVLHGATADHQVWAEQLQPFADEFRVILYDLRGHGKTGGSDLNRYTVETYAEDLAAFIESLDLDRPTILGHSWGGMVGYTFADEHPDRLSGLITVGSSTPRTFSKQEWLFKVGVSRLVTPFVGSERFVNAFTWAQEKAFGDEAAGDMSELERLRNAHDCDDWEVEASERAKIWRATAEYFGSDRSWKIPGTPVLMLYGENEPMIEDHGDYLESQLAACHSTEIPEAGHNSHVDNPEFIRAQIREFLASHAPTVDTEPQC